MSDLSQSSNKIEASDNGGESDLTFPMKLMDILSNEKYQDILQWLPQGDGFIIHDKQRCADEVLPHHFGTVSKYSSFTRRLNRWNFIFQQKGNKKALYFHPLFVRANPSLCLNMRPRRQKNYNQKYSKNIDHKHRHFHEQHVQEGFNSRHDGEDITSFTPTFENQQMIPHFPNTTADHQTRMKNSTVPHYHLENSSFTSQTLQIALTQSGGTDLEMYRYLHSSAPGGGQAMFPGPGNAMLNVQNHPHQQLQQGIMAGFYPYPSYKTTNYDAVHHMPRKGILDDSFVTEEGMSAPPQYYVPLFAAASSSGQPMQFAGADGYMGYKMYYSQPIMFPTNQKPIG
mmetsp:Transcript_11498/g.21502  ORF Transcript_11498/g.21502 Transcript_11498/m.21502 type:complete len:341 (+) Transcript_11498:177-1199(+)